MSRRAAPEEVRRARFADAYREGQSVAQLAQLAGVSQAAMIDLLESEGIERAEPLALRRFSWQDEAA